MKRRKDSVLLPFLFMGRLFRELTAVLMLLWEDYSAN